MDGNERIQWALDFANADLTMASERDWVRLRSDAREFVNASGEHSPGLTETGGIIFMPIPKGDAFTAASIKKLQEEVVRLFSAFGFRQELAKTHSAMGRGTDRVVAGGQWHLYVMGGERDDFALQLTDTDWTQAFLLILMNLLCDKDTARVRKCPICGTMFARVRRQEYCSRRCANIASKKAYRARVKK